MTGGNAAGVVLAAEGRLAEIRAERDRIVDEVSPLLVGRRIRELGFTYQIVAVNAWGNELHGYGVRVSKSGRVGTRGFSIRIDPAKLLEEN